MPRGNSSLTTSWSIATTAMPPSKSTAPAIKKGWLRKKARSGLFKNWRTRFFVLADGRITYYKNEISQAPFGDEEKVRENPSQLSLYSRLKHVW